MKILPRKPTYADAKIEAIAQQALATDPMIADPAIFAISSRKGVIHIEGTVHRDEEKQRIERVVASALQHTELRHDHIVNDLRVVTLAGTP